ncbi:MAG: type II toxin-antitoxin system VapC family toxin [Rhizomicrobium sp.]|jgi:predicted nucleic acid-binding protein
MAILDASVVVEILLRTDAGRVALRLIATERQGVHAPHLLDIEVMYALRRLVLKQELSRQEAETAVEFLPQLQIMRHAHVLLLPRIWALREAITAYDAAYVALAEILDLPLWTCDAKLSRSHGHRAKIVLLT